MAWQERGRGDTAADWSAIDGGGLVQLIITTFNPFVFHLFINGREIPQPTVDSLYVTVGLPDNPTDPPSQVATLTTLITDLAGQKTKQSQSVFPGTLEVVAGGKRVTLSCPDPDDPLEMYVRLGLRPDGTNNAIESGLHSIQVFLNPGLGMMQFNLKWSDGLEETLIGTSSSSLL
jgi:hypothetical protein